jgi:hypothetical protein
MGLNLTFRVGGSLVVVWALVSGCTVSSTPPPPAETCSTDNAVVCSDGDGYSCTGGGSPTATDSTLNCSDGVPESNGNTGYCCNPTSVASVCSADSTVSCPGSTGYSCTGVDSPDESDPTLSCGDGVSGGNSETDYCCATTTTSSCAPDSSVVGCTGGSFGFSCTSTDTPSDGDSSLDCSDPIAGSNGGSLFCCVTFTTTGSSCAPDSSVVGCTGDSYGFSCTSTDTPTDANASLVCSASTNGPNGELLYCCQNG